MHHLCPYVYHLDSFWNGTQITNVLVQSDIVVLHSSRTRFERFRLDMVTNILQILLFFGGELYKQVNSYAMDITISENY